MQKLVLRKKKPSKVLLWNHLLFSAFNFSNFTFFPSYIIIRAWISSSHFTKCKVILSFSEALSQWNNSNENLCISFLAPKFHLVTIIFKQDNVLQKHLISWYNLILSPHQANFECFECLIFLSHSVSYNCQITVKCSRFK